MRTHLPALLCLVPALGGCGGSPPPSGGKSYALEGKVVSVDPAERSVTLDHEEIVGFMPAMTMPFVVLEGHAALLEHVSPGDRVSARLVVADSRYWLEDLVVVKKGEPDPDAPPRPAAHVPHEGDAVPDVALVNQDARAIRISDYRDRALAITFVFTRCPLPDFCPLMMKNLATVQEALVADEGLRAATHLLAISFDPEHDTPEVLRAYGMPFQKTTPPFTHWELATGTHEEIRNLGGALGLDYVEEDRSFTHNLRTAVVDREGKLHALLRGNAWTPEELVAHLRVAAGS